MRFSTLVMLLPLAVASPTAQRQAPAPLHTNDKSQGTKYVVKFYDNSAMSVVESVLAKHGNKDHGNHIYESTIKGFASHLSPEALAAIRAMPEVEYVEQESVGRIGGFVTQSHTEWGLARISHRKPGGTNYTYDSTAGKGVCAYVVDSGVNVTAEDFGGRAHQIKSYFDNSDDENGHGTNVAGILGSKTYGVAKAVDIYSIKIADASSTINSSTAIAGIEYVIKDVPNRSCPKGVVVNLSIYFDATQSLDDATQKLIDKGYFVSICAGNDGKNATLVSPARLAGGCTVGAMDKSDKVWANSNWGKSVDIMAPGVGIVATGRDGNTSIYTGTSQATPHVAGLAAYYASKDGKGMAGMCDTVVSNASKDYLTNQRKDTVNLIAFNGYVPPKPKGPKL